MASEVDRSASIAWEYHLAADSILHTRVEALLICQAFLAAAYVGLLAGNVQFGGWLSFAVIVLAVSISVIFLDANRRLLKGITFLKRKIVEQDGGLYQMYLEAVGSKALEGKGGNTSVSIRLCYILLAFWLFAAVHLAAVFLISEPAAL